MKERNKTIRGYVILSLVVVTALVFGSWLFGPVAKVFAQEGQGEQEAPGEIVQEPGKLGALERAVEKAIQDRTLSETLNLELYGFVDVSYTQNFGNPITGVNNLRIFDVDSDAFRVHMAQIVLQREGKTGGKLLDHAGFRIKLNFGEDSQFTGGSDFGDEVDFQEVYVQFVAPFGNGIDLRMGRQNTLIGYEVIESPYNPNFSRSFMFGLGEPFTTTGIRAAYDINEQLSFAIGGISSFTQGPGDTNNTTSLESAVSYNPNDMIGVTGFLFWGDEAPRGSQVNGDLILGGGILNLQATEQTSFVVEAYYANQANASTISPAGNGRWNGVAGYLIHDFTDQWGLRVRGEIFEDAGGTRTCTGTLALPNANVCFGATGAAPAAPVAQTLWETTFTLMYKPVSTIMTRLEYRYDKSNKNTFQIGNRAANHQNTLAFEAIYLF